DRKPGPPRGRMRDPHDERRRAPIAPRTRARPAAPDAVGRAVAGCDPWRGGRRRGATAFVARAGRDAWDLAEPWVCGVRRALRRGLRRGPTRLGHVRRGRLAGARHSGRRALDRDAALAALDGGERVAYVGTFSK